MPELDENFWEEIILTMEEGKVVPIVGRDLLLVQTDTGPRFYHNIVAEKLAQELRVPVAGLPPNYDANDVICASDDFRGDPTTANIRMVRILKSLKDKVPIPESLRLLAEIDVFSLFVSTTFDMLLEDAIEGVRKRPPAVVAFPPASNLTDFDPALIAEHGCAVFQILGRATATAGFGLTEGQVLEQMHEVMVGSGRPTRLLRYLQDSHLLVLGVSFPDWLARFLLRLSRAKPLWDSRATTEVIAEIGAQEDLSGFLRHFSPRQSHLYTGGSPVEFVQELHRQWFLRHPVSAAPVQTTGGEPPPAEMVPGSVFISYASEDRTAAFRLADDLTAKGIEVWVDRRLQPGDRFLSIIDHHIADCCAFVAVLSATTQREEERWYRREWGLAYDRGKKQFATILRYIFPVVVDSTPIREISPVKLGLFAEENATVAPLGVAPDGLVRVLTEVQKEWRRKNR